MSRFQQSSAALLRLPRSQNSSGIAYSSLEVRPSPRLRWGAVGKRLTPVALEFGGNSPAIVHSSAELHVAARCITPYLIVPGVPWLLRFLVKAFGAIELARVRRADRSVMHAEVTIGDSIIMMGEPTDTISPMA